MKLTRWPLMGELLVQQGGA